MIANASMPLARTPPASNLAEGQVLGSMLLDDGKWVLPMKDMLVAEDFFAPAHQTIFTVLCEMFAEHKPWEPASFFYEFGERGLLGQIGRGADDDAGAVQGVDRT